MKTDELIVQLASAAEPVHVLPRPSVRLARWTAIALIVAGLAVVIVGPRADFTSVIQQPIYLVLALATLAIALLSAAAAFVSSVPGAERSRVQRLVPLVIVGMWGLGLLVLVSASGDPLQRVTALVHIACVLEIAGVGLVSGWMLFRMLRRAAPLDPTWSAALAALAATGAGAFAAHLICPIDVPAHHLVGHFVPVLVFVIAGSAAGRRSLVWLRGRRYPSVA